MSEYFKFWLAKELVPFVWIAAIALIFGSVVAYFYVADKISKFRKRLGQKGH